MIVKCEACGTRYRLDDERVKPGGVKVRCSRCGHVFTLYPEVPKVEAPPVEEAPPEPERAPPEEPAKDEALSPELQEEIFPFAEESEAALEIAEERGGPKLLVVLLAVLLGLLAFVLVFMNRERIPFVKKLFSKVTQVMEVKEHLFPLSHLKGYRLVVQGKEVFVVEGRVINRSKDPRRWVKLQGKLLDRSGRVVATGVGFSGRYLPRGEIEGMALPLLEDFSRRRQPSGVAPLAPGDSAPFTILFVSPPSGATDFQVEVLEAPSL